jgi:2-oxoglutarate dehydrogenase E2 component (dihydrolipoamide succinyltransferase)
MRIEVKVPQLPESVTEATLVSWHKKAGDAVKRDENLIDVETDKVVLELPAPSDGVLVEITRARRLDGHIERRHRRDRYGRQGRAGARRGRQKRRRARHRRACTRSCAAQHRRPRRRPATALPAARKMMADQGVDPASVTGTGRGGRATKATSPRRSKRVRNRLRHPRKRRRRRPLRSRPLRRRPPRWVLGPSSACPCRDCASASPTPRAVASTAAILTTFNEVNMQPVIELRNRYKERFEKEHGVKLGFMASS